MEQYKNGDKVVHLGGAKGQTSRNRGSVLTILEGPIKIVGYTGVRYIVDRPVYITGHPKPIVYHADAEYLLKLK